MDESELLALLEAHLLVSTEPVRPADIAKLLGLERDLVELAYASLSELYERRDTSGIRIFRLSGGYQMATRPDLSLEIARLLALPKETNRLSKPALETVAVVAYRQPVTTAEIEAIRGVAVDGVLKTLSERRLVQETGDLPRQPIGLIGIVPRQRADETAAGERKGRVSIGAETAVDGIAQETGGEPALGEPCADSVRRAIVRCVIGDDHLEVAEGLSRKRFKAFHDEFGVIVGRDQDADRRAGIHKETVFRVSTGMATPP